MVGYPSDSLASCQLCGKHGTLTPAINRILNSYSSRG